MRREELTVLTAERTGDQWGLYLNNNGDKWRTIRRHCGSDEVLLRETTEDSFQTGD